MHRDKIRIHTKLIAGSPGDGNRILDSCPNIHLVPYTNPEEVRSTFLVWYGAGRPSSGRLHLSRSQFSSLRHSSLFRRSRFATDRKSTRLNSSHRTTSYAVFCLKKKNPAPGASVAKTGPRRRS